MPRQIATDSRDSARRPVSIDALSVCRWHWRVQSDARVIVIKDEDTRVLRIDCAADTRIPRTEITVFGVLWTRRALVLNRLAAPGTILAMGCHNHPFFTDRKSVV